MPVRTAGTPPPGRELVVEGLELTYPSERGAPVRALDGVSLRAGAGELVAVVGPSGCGKTTLLEVVCGLRGADRGTVAGPPAVLMPQRDLLLPWLDALENAALSLRLAGQRRKTANAGAQELFCELGLEGFERARPEELSGGMRQRVAFARTLLSGKQLLCLDEPFAGLDAITRSEMQQWLARSLQREPRTVLLVTHDVEEAIVLGDRVVVLSRRPGRVLGRAGGVARTPAPRGRCRGGGAAGARTADARRGRGRVVRASLRRIAPAALLALVLLGVWELYCDLGGVEAAVLPAPHEVASRAVGQQRPAGPQLRRHRRGGRCSGSRWRWWPGWRWRSRSTSPPLLRRAFYPLAVGSQAIPIPVIGVLLVFWWGFGIFPKLVVIALICFFPVLVTTIDGLASLDPERVKLLRTLDASRWQALRFAELPAALPAALSGARIALAVGVIGAFIAETSTPTTGTYTGLGREIVLDAGGFQTARAYAATVLLFAFALACFYSLAVAERRLAPWRRPAAASAWRDADACAARCLACLAGACLLALGACGAKQDTLSAAGHEALHGDAGLVPERRPRRPLRGARARRVPGRGPRREADRALADRRTAEAARRRARSTWRSPMSPSCCWRATRACGWFRSARSCSAR